MADISTYLDQILTAIYGEDVRTSIHHAIRDMNSQLNTAVSSELNALGFKGDLGTSDGTTYNLNSLTETNRRGIWRLQANRNYTNAPDDYDQTKTGYLIVYSFGTVDSTASNIKQEIHYFSDSGANANVCWSRVYISGSWTEWKKNVDNTLSTEGAAADAFVVGTRLNNIMNKWALMSYIEPITSDIDDKIAQGIYYVWSSTVPNWPFDTTGLLLILNAHNQNRETSGPSAGALVQMAFVDGAMAYRMYGTNGWGDWTSSDTDASLSIEGAAADAKAVGDKALISKQVYLPVGDNANLNNFYTQGIYSVMAPQGTQNWPFENTSGLFIVLNANNDLGTFITYAVAQIAICDGKYAFRSSVVGSSGPKYSDWVIYEIDDTLSVSGAAADAKAVGDAISSAVENVVSSKGLAMSTDPEHPVKNLNEYKTPGIYYVGATRVTNWAFDDNYRGVLVVFNPMASAAAMTDSIVQMAFSNGELAYRMFNGYGTGQTELWSDWIKNDNDRLIQIIGNIADVNSVQNEIEATENQNYYLEKTSATTCTVKSSTGTELVIYFVAVTAKKNYRVTATNVASIDNAILAFSTRALADNVGCSMLIDNTGGPTIDYAYSPTQDGYLFLSKGTNTSMTYHIYEVEDQATLKTDKTLSVENVPADAKTVGDVKSAINQSAGDIYLVTGTYSGNDGVTPSDTNIRIRNAFPIYAKHIKIIQMPDAYDVWWYALDENKALLSQTAGWTKSIKIDQLPVNTSYINFGIRKTASPSSDISNDIPIVRSGLIIITKNDEDIDDIKNQLIDSIEQNEQYNSALVTNRVNKICLSTKSDGKIYERNNSIDIIVSSNGSCSIFSRIRVTAGTTYYYRNLYGYFTKIVYDDETYEYLKSDTYAYSAGSVAIQKDGYIYITVSQSASGIILFTDYEYLYTAQSDGWFLPNLLKTIMVYPVIITDNTLLSDANLVTDSSIYRIQLSGTAPDHLPSDITTNTWLLISLSFIAGNNRNTLQYLFNYHKQQFMYQRNAYNNNQTWSDWISMITTEPVFYVGSSEEFVRLRDGIAKAVKYRNAKVIVRAGTYDLISEFSNEIALSTNVNFGIVLENGVHVIFDSGALVTAYYEGNDSNILRNFSPFLAGSTSGGFTLENLNIQTKNTRYCVHDDLGDYDIISCNKYINCRMVHDDRTNTIKAYPQCIGGGFGRHTYVEIRNCYFRSYGSDGYANPLVSYHNSWKFNDAKSSVLISNSYFYGKGTYRTSHHGPSSSISLTTINNSSLGSAPVIEHEVSGSTDPENTAILQYMNEIRQ